MMLMADVSNSEFVHRKSEIAFQTDTKINFMSQTLQIGHQHHILASYVVDRLQCHQQTFFVSNIWSLTSLPPF